MRRRIRRWISILTGERRRLWAWALAIHDRHYWDVRVREAEAELRTAAWKRFQGLDRWTRTIEEDRAHARLQNILLARDFYGRRRPPSAP